MRFGTRKRVEPEKDGDLTSEVAQSPGLLRPQSYAALLSTPRRELLIQNIWQRTSLSRAQFQRLYQAPIERYAALVQHFPASEAHHHAHLGGMLDHGLEIVAFSLKLRQSYLLPIGAAPETQAAQAEAWSAATAYAALLHDIGKLAVDLEVEHGDGTTWHPWHGVLTEPYRFRFRAHRLHRLHEAATGLLYTQILGTSILDWLSGFPELWAALLYVLASRHEDAGVLGELVAQADRASVAQALGGNPEKARPDTIQSLQRKLRDGLRYLVRERFRLNQPQASDGWLTKDALWLVSKTACDKLRAHLLSNGITGVPENNGVLFDVLQEHALVQVTSEGRAIWTARVLGTNGWTQEFTFLKVAPTLIWDSGDRPAPYSGRVITASTETRDNVTNDAQQPPPLPEERVAESTQPPNPKPETMRPEHTSVKARSPADQVSPERQVDLLADTTDKQSLSCAESIALSEPTAEAQPESSIAPGDASLSHANPHGERFLNWLTTAVRSRRLVVNDAKALVHTVDGTAFIVTPRIFQRFLQEYPVIRFESRDPQQSGWVGIQKSFERLGRHRKQANGLNIWLCEVAGPRRKTRHVNGYLLRDGHDLFADIPPDNPYLKLTTVVSAEERSFSTARTNARQAFDNALQMSSSSASTSLPENNQDSES